MKTRASSWRASATWPTTPVLRDALIMMGVVGMLAYEFQVSLPLMAKHTFGGGSALYGLLNSSQGVGAVVGGLIAAGRPGRGPRRLVNTSLVFGVVIVLAALAPTSATEVVALLFVGAASVTFLSLGNSTLQLEADPSMRGRVMSLWSVAFQGSTPIGGPLVGVDRRGARRPLRPGRRRRRLPGRRRLRLPDPVAGADGPWSRTGTAVVPTALSPERGAGRRRRYGGRSC